MHHVIYTYVLCYSDACVGCMLAAAGTQVMILYGWDAGKVCTW
jgi:hypothetical protein